MLPLYPRALPGRAPKTAPDGFRVSKTPLLSKEGCPGGCRGGVVPLRATDFAKRSLPLVVAAVLFGAAAASAAQVRDFRVLSLDPSGQRVTRNMRGVEVPNNSLNRLSTISEAQVRYPDPLTACGPVALLNILVWYEKYGLIEPDARHADTTRYKKALFREIDRRLAEISGRRRAAGGGTRNADAAIVLDRIVSERSGGRIRIHTDYIPAPIELGDLLESMPNFRAGYLTVHPLDHRTGELRNLHAATLIRADRAGYLTVGTWGDKYRGLLRRRGGHQWLIPGGPDQFDLRVEGLLRFTPFRPAKAHAGR